MLVIMLCHNVGLDHNKKHTTKSHNVCSQHSTPAPQIERMPLPRSTPSVQEHVLIAELLDETTAVAPKSLSNRGWSKAANRLSRASGAQSVPTRTPSATAAVPSDDRPPQRNTCTNDNSRHRTAHPYAGGCRPQTMVKQSRVLLLRSVTYDGGDDGGACEYDDDDGQTRGKGFCIMFSDVHADGQCNCQGTVSLPSTCAFGDGDGYGDADDDDTKGGGHGGDDD